MAPLEECFALEVEFHRRLRAVTTASAADAAALHTSYALQGGYERLLRATGRVTVQEIERLAQRYMLSGDSRDVLGARDSLACLLGLRPFER